MSRLDDTVWCAGCGTEICWGCYGTNNQNYCCQDCALGFSCTCENALEWDEDYRDVTTLEVAIYPRN